MVGHGGSSAISYLADLTSPIPSHCASIDVTSTLRVKPHKTKWQTTLIWGFMGNRSADSLFIMLWQNSISCAGIYWSVCLGAFSHGGWCHSASFAHCWNTYACCTVTEPSLLGTPWQVLVSWLTWKKTKMLHISRLTTHSHNQNDRYCCICVSINAHYNGFSRKVRVCVKSYSASRDAQCKGMGDVGSARYEPALLPPCPTIRVLSYSN